MELKEFIKTTIADIAQTVVELNREQSSTGLIVNPTPDNYIDNARVTGDGRNIQDIEFNLQVVAIEKSDLSGGLGIQVLKANMKSEEHQQTANEIRFSIPVALPTVR